MNITDEQEYTRQWLAEEIESKLHCLPFETLLRMAKTAGIKGLSDLNLLNDRRWLAEQGLSDPKGRRHTEWGIQ